MFLSEHRRCQDSIISYCNELAYHGSLEPLAEENNKYPFLPYIGFTHIDGAALQIGGSLSNVIEAQTIAKWIKENEDTLTNISGKSIEETIAIITPFYQQKLTIKKELDSRFHNITVGTVH